MRYCPLSSVTLARTFVISAGLDASTVTPGSTPPDESRTAPARLCAEASAGASHTMHSARKIPRTILVLMSSLSAVGTFPTTQGPRLASDTGVLQ